MNQKMRTQIAIMNGFQVTEYDSIDLDDEYLTHLLQKDRQLNSETQAKQIKESPSTVQRKGLQTGLGAPMA